MFLEEVYAECRRPDYDPDPEKVGKAIAILARGAGDAITNMTTRPEAKRGVRKPGPSLASLLE
jgi:hypothetical protein